MEKLIIGLDIGTQNIKAVELSREKDSYKLLAAGSIPKPVLSSQATKDGSDEQKIANSINRLVHDMKVTTTNVVLSLPSVNVITRIIDAPQMTEKELQSSISWEAEQYIPLPLSKVKLDYSIIENIEGEKTMKILLVAAPINLITKYINIMTLSELTPVAIETEIVALTRAVNVSYPNLSNLLVIQMGATATHLILLHNHDLIYTKSTPIGGNTLTRAISKELGFEIAQAEEYKKTYGMDKAKLEGKIVKIISPFIEEIFSETEKTIAFFKKKYQSEELSTIVLSGGSTKLPGYVSSFTRTLGIDSQVINPFANINADPNVLSVLSSDSQIYSAAIGLALKDI